MKHNMYGSIHGPGATPHELQHGCKPDLLIMPMIPFGSFVMTHVPLNHSDRSIRIYTVGTALHHKGAKGGLILFNLLTFTIKQRKQRDRDDHDTRHSNSQCRCNEYEQLIGTIYRDDEAHFALCKTVDVEQVFDEADLPLIVSYRRRLQPNGRFEPVNEDDEYPYHIGDIVHMIEEYANLNPEQMSKKVSKKLSNQLLTFGIVLQPESDMRPASKPEVDWDKILPRTFAEVLSMPVDHPNHAGFVASTADEIKSIHEMGTYEPDEAQMKILKIFMSKIVVPNKYQPGNSFDKYKGRIVLRGDSWYDL